MKPALLLIATAGAVYAGCVPVSAGRVTTADLQDALPKFKLIDSPVSLGFAPLPGTQRVIKVRDLAAILQRSGVEIDNEAQLRDVCVEREAHPISAAAMRSALFGALGLADAEIDLLDFTRENLPSGHMEFQRANLNNPPPAAPANAVIWRGRLVYEEGRSAAIWAKVRISVEKTWLIAQENIPAGDLIQSDDVQRVIGREFPYPNVSLSAEASVVGKLARRNIKKGERLRATLLKDQNDIENGDHVHVKVLQGQASVLFDGIARCSGKKGDRIMVQNPATGRNFNAVVVEKGQVVLRLSPGG